MQLVVCKWESVFTCSGPYWSCLFRLVSPVRGRRGTSWQNWRRFCHIFLEQSVSLSDWSTHSCNTRLLAWQQSVDQSEKSCEKLWRQPSNFKQYFQTKLCSKKMWQNWRRFYRDVGPLVVPFVPWCCYQSQRPRSNVPAPATTSQPDEYKMRWQW